MRAINKIIIIACLIFLLLPLAYSAFAEEGPTLERRSFNTSFEYGPVKSESAKEEPAHVKIGKPEPEEKPKPEGSPKPVKTEKIKPKKTEPNGNVFAGGVQKVNPALPEKNAKKAAPVKREKAEKNIAPEKKKEIAPRKEVKEKAVKPQLEKQKAPLKEPETKPEAKKSEKAVKTDHFLRGQKMWPPDTKPDQVLVLKKIDLSRIGAEAAYEEFAGLRFAKYFSVGQEVQIYQEAKPIDAYILNAQALRVLRDGIGGVNIRGFPISDKDEEWKTPAQYRSQIVPQFTRAYRTQFTMDNPQDPSGQVAQIRYTLDYRDIYKQYYPLYPNIKVERWLQNEVMFIHGMQIPGINWRYTINLGYRYTSISAKDTPGELPPTVWHHTYHATDEERHYFLSNLSIAPNDQFEWFGLFEYFAARHPRIDNTLGDAWESYPDHFWYRTEFRFKSLDQKTSLIPWFSYSIDRYYPLRDVFEKYEMGARLARDFTKRLSATTQIQYVMGLNAATDNRLPTWPRRPNPLKTFAGWVGTENRASYNVWDKFYLRGGVDFAAGTNTCDFDNWATLLGGEYYNPGVFRVNFDWQMHHYYNIDDFLNTIAVKFYFFI